MEPGRKIKMKKHTLIAMLLIISFFAAANDDAKKEDTRKGIKIDFSTAKMDDGVPENWKYKGKPFTKDVTYALVKDPESGKQALKITSDKATGAILYDMDKIDLNKYPVIRWKWKAELLPAGADANVKAKDDQGIAIFMGHGRFSQESVSYAWQTETKKGTKGFSNYNGVVDVHWFSVRDKNDGMNKWFTEEKNIKNDILAEMKLKKLPSGLGLSISSNSQYTGTKSVTYIEYIEFLPEK